MSNGFEMVSGGISFGLTRIAPSGIRSSSPDMQTEEVGAGEGESWVESIEEIVSHAALWIALRKIFEGVWVWEGIGKESETEEVGLEPLSPFFSCFFTTLVTLFLGIF